MLRDTSDIVRCIPMLHGSSDIDNLYYYVVTRVTYGILVWFKIIVLAVNL